MKIYLLIEEDDILEEIKDGRGAKQGDREFIIKKSSANSYEFPNFFEAQRVRNWKVTEEEFERGKKLLLKKDNEKITKVKKYQDDDEDMDDGNGRKHEDNKNETEDEEIRKHGRIKEEYTNRQMKI